MVRVRVRVEPLLARLCLQFLGLLHRRHAQALDGLWVARHAVGGIVEVFTCREGVESALLSRSARAFRSDDIRVRKL